MDDEVAHPALHPSDQRSHPHVKLRIYQQVIRAACYPTLVVPGVHYCSAAARSVNVGIIEDGACPTNRGRIVRIDERRRGTLLDPVVDVTTAPEELRLLLGVGQTVAIGVLVPFCDPVTLPFERSVKLNTPTTAMVFTSNPCSPSRPPVLGVPPVLGAPPVVAIPPVAEAPPVSLPPVAAPPVGTPTGATQVSWGTISRRAPERRPAGTPSRRP